MLMDVIIPTIVGTLAFMSMTSFMNVLRLICHDGGYKKQILGEHNSPITLNF